MEVKEQLNRGLRAIQPKFVSSQRAVSESLLKLPKRLEHNNDSRKLKIAPAQYFGWQREQIDQEQRHFEHESGPKIQNNLPRNQLNCRRAKEKRFKRASIHLERKRKGQLHPEPKSEARIKAGQKVCSKHQSPVAPKLNEAKISRF